MMNKIFLSTLFVLLFFTNSYAQLVIRKDAISDDAPSSYQDGAYVIPSESDAPSSWIFDAGVVLGLKPESNISRHTQLIFDYKGQRAALRSKNQGNNLWTSWNNFMLTNSNGELLLVDESKGLNFKTPTTNKNTSITLFGNLSSTMFENQNNFYYKYSGACYTNGASNQISNYITYTSSFGSYLNYKNQGYGFYSKGPYPTMFMEVTSGSFNGITNLPSDSPIMKDYLYQQILGPSFLDNGGNSIPDGSALKATKSNSKWLWGVKKNGEFVIAGKVHAQEVKVTANAGTVPDYVFKEDYHMMSLEDVENYIKKHSHLPEVKSAAQIEEEGLHLAEMNLILLKKIEELTLHTIEQEKKIKSLEAKDKEIEEVKSLLYKQQKLIDQLLQEK
ncbi:hypothetical protein [Flammeovirga sp. SJP92]|uniref:hypothetical protein n=1 Tax=Flammeovirga sp. SJP92 TaxID=1775430 RepID=UPI000789048B|nr:hypothetical protein [Flammeovirga sp. SJP92]KXX71230.1 hypothetical protein AVL50_09240 [Flammeovirga sp. SJP92]